MSFLTGQFLSVLKIAKVIPIHKKQSKVDYANYRPISLLSNIERIIEKLTYKRLPHFLDINNLIYSLQFGFQQKYSTTHALINLTESIRQTLDEGSFGCGIFVDLQKAFDTVDHKILLHKLEFYGIRGVCNDWFKSYLSDRKQFVSINGYNSDLMPVIYGVPQGSVLGPLLFLIYINDLHKAIRYCKVHHFADDTNLFHTNKSVKNLNKLVNHDMKQLNNWLSANKISLNVEKTELVIFKSPRKVLSDEIKIKLTGKRLYPSNSVKYLGVRIDKFLHWHDQVNNIAVKLNRANALLLKIRNYVNMKTLRNIYYAIFDSHLTYSCIVWAQNINTVNRLIILQKKALRIMNFKDQLFHSSPLFSENNILKFIDKITLENILFVNKSINRQVPPIFYDWFTFSGDLHRYETCWSVTDHLIIPTFWTQKCGRFSITASTIYSWKSIQNLLIKNLSLENSISKKISLNISVLNSS